MEVYILTEIKRQSEYTEPKYYESADDSMDIIGVYSTKEKATLKKARMESLFAECADDGDGVSYYIRTMILE